MTFKYYADLGNGSSRVKVKRGRPAKTGPGIYSREQQRVFNLAKRHELLDQKFPVEFLRCRCKWENCFASFTPETLRKHRVDYFAIRREDERKEYLKVNLRPAVDFSDGRDGHPVPEEQRCETLFLMGNPVCGSSLNMLFGISWGLIACIKNTPSCVKVCMLSGWLHSF